MSMEKEFVPYEPSLELEEIGFNEPCFGYFRDGKFSGVNKWNRKDFELHTISLSDVTNVTNEIILAPTFSQAFRWFREKYEFQSEVTAYGTRNGYSYLFKILVDSGSYHKVSDIIDCYEEAELECLKKLIKIAKSK